MFGPNRPEPKPGELPGRPVDPDTTGGYYQPTAAEIDGVLALGSVRLSCGLVGAPRPALLEYNERYRANLNPRIAGVELGAGGLLLTPLEAEQPAAPVPTVAAGSSVPLRVFWEDCGASEACGAEPYVSFDAEAGALVERRESLRVAWYASGGKFELELTGREEQDPGTDSQNTWFAPTEPGEHVLWLVLRDSRGGSSWHTYRAMVTP